MLRSDSKQILLILPSKDPQPKLGVTTLLPASALRNNKQIPPGTGRQPESRMWHSIMTCENSMPSFAWKNCHFWLQSGDATDIFVVLRNSWHWCPFCYKQFVPAYIMQLYQDKTTNIIGWHFSLQIKFWCSLPSMLTLHQSVRNPWLRLIADTWIKLDRNINYNPLERIFHSLPVFS